MQITAYVEQSPTKKSITLEIPVEEVDHATDHAARSLARSVKIPGFRPGKVPVDLVKKRFAEELKGEVLETLLGDALREAIEEKKLVLIGQPKVEDLKFEPGQPVTFRAEVEVRVPIALRDYRGLKVPTEATVPTPEEVDTFLEELRRSRSSYEPVEDRPAADGDFALVDIKGSYPGGDGQDFERDKVLVEIGGGETLPEISAHLRNAEPGVTVSFQKDFPADASDPDFAGKTVLYHVTLHALKKRVLPELDDELARQVLSPRDGGPAPEGVGLAQLREQVSISLGREKERSLLEKRRRAALDGLLALHDVEAPESMVEAEVDSALREYARLLSRQGVDLKEAKIDWNRLRGEAHPSAVRRVKEYLLLDAVGDAEKIEVTDTEVDAEIKRRAAGSGSPASELKAALKKAGRLEGLREELRLEKAVQLLLTEAVQAG